MTEYALQIQHLSSCYLIEFIREALKERKKHPKKSNTKNFFSAPLAPLRNSLCLRFPTLRRENAARTQRISGVEGP